MKKILFLAVLLLTVSQLYGADYLDSLAKMTARVKQDLNLGSAVTEPSDSLVREKIKEGAIIVNAVLKSQVAIDTIITTSGNFIYSLDSQIIKIVEVYWKSNRLVWPIKLIDPKDFDSVFSFSIDEAGDEFDEEEAISHPSHYNWHHGYIKLFPVPYVFNSADTVIIFGYSKVQSIESDVSFLSDIPVTYRPIVEAYAAYSVAIIKDIKTKDQSYKDKFLMLIELIEKKFEFRDRLK